MEDKLAPVPTLLYGLQHVIVSNVWLDPLFVAALIGLPVAVASNMVNAIFLAAGVVTLLQAMRLARLPVVQGPSAAFDALMIAAGKAKGLGAAGGGILLSAGIVLLLALTGVLQKMRVLFTPVVTGTVIAVVGFALSGFTLYEFLGGSAGTPTFLSGSTLAMSIPTALLVILLSAFGKGLWRSYAFLIALVVGDGIALATGKLSFASVGEKAWFGLPQWLPYGSLTLDWSVFATFFVAYIVAVIEAMGVYAVAAEYVGVPLDGKRIRNGFAGEAVGSMLSTLVGGFPTTAYAQNVSLLRLTGIGSRFTVIVAGLIFILLGFVPKAGAVLASTPDAVVGGLFLPAAASLVITGVSILGRMEKTESNRLVAGLSLLLAVALPQACNGVTGWAAPFLTNTVLVGALSAVVLQAVLVQIPRVFGRRAE
nr:solute carrier family 23 protein [Tumebacillus amylolyticus]